jgi:hypothetical protein
MPTTVVSLDCTGTAAVAVLRHHDGLTEQLLFDGAAQLPGGAYLADVGFLTGRDALDAATTAPERYIPAPLRLLEAEPTPNNGPDPIEVVAALLRRIREQATQHANKPVNTAIIVVPPGWGPQRRTRLRTAAHQAGLTDVEFVDAAAALTRRLLGAPAANASATVLVCRPRANSSDVTILRANAGAYEPVAALTSSADDDLDGENPTTRALTLAAQSLTAAEITAADITAALLVAPATDLPRLASGLRQLGITAASRVGTDTDAVYGALTLTDATTPTPRPRRGQTRHAIAAAIPLPAALALLYLLLQTGLRPTDPGVLAESPAPPYLYTLWPAWSMVAVLAFIGTLAIVLARADQRLRTAPQTAEPDQRRLLARGLHLTGAMSLIAGLVTTMLATISYQLVPTWYILLWAAIPALVLAATSALIAALIQHGYTSALRWQIWLRLPNTTTVLAAAGLLTIHAYLYTNLSPTWYIHHPPLPNGIDELGTIAAAVAVLPLVAHRFDHQILLSPLVVGVVIWTHSYTNMALVIGALLAAITLWWITRIRPAGAYSDQNHPATRMAHELEPTSQP